MQLKSTLIHTEIFAKSSWLSRNRSTVAAAAVLLLLSNVDKCNEEQIHHGMKLSSAPPTNMHHKTCSPNTHA